MISQDIFTIEMLKQSLEFAFSNNYVFIALNIFMWFACYTDMLEFKIYDKFNIIMFIFRLMIFPIFPITMNIILGGVLVFLVFLISAMITYDSIGGDIKFGGNVGLWLGFTPSILFVLIAMVSNLVFRLFVGTKKTLPLAPFFYFSYMMLFALLSYL